MRDAPASASAFRLNSAGSELQTDPVSENANRRTPVRARLPEWTRSRSGSTSWATASGIGSTKDALSRVSLELHRRFLRRHVPRDVEVLEIGAGPGRFTIELAGMGCRLVVSDVSAIQLALNERHVAEAEAEAAVIERRLLDIRDLSSVPDGSFDAVVAYGGPLSYAFEDAEVCLGEMLRVVRPGGRVVASVMDSIGTLSVFVRDIPLYAAKGRLETLRRVMATGDNRLNEGAHPCRMFRWREIEAMVLRLPCSLVEHRHRTSCPLAIRRSSATSSRTETSGTSSSTGRRSTAASRGRWTAVRICYSRWNAVEQVPPRSRNPRASGCTRDAQDPPRCDECEC